MCKTLTTFFFHIKNKNGEISLKSPFYIFQLGIYVVLNCAVNTAISLLACAVLNTKVCQFLQYPTILAYKRIV